MLLTFLEAKNILRQRDRLPNKDLKLRAGLVWDRELELSENVFGCEVELSEFEDFCILCLGLEEEEEEE